jgi:hypothetical protein
MSFVSTVQKYTFFLKCNRKSTFFSLFSENCVPLHRQTKNRRPASVLHTALTVRENNPSPAIPLT